MSRRLCPDCARPPARCHCDLIVPVHNPTPVVIWQHPKETNHPKNTAALLAECLDNVQTLRAEMLDETQLAQLTRPGTALLYPGGAGSETAEPGGITQLLVIDATWRKSRKMLYLNPSVGALPRIALTPQRASAYRIRRAPRPGQLSTLEASCYALHHIERAPERYQPVLTAFDCYMDRLSNRMPAHHRP